MRRDLGNKSYLSEPNKVSMKTGFSPYYLLWQDVQTTIKHVCIHPALTCSFTYSFINYL